MTEPRTETLRRNALSGLIAGVIFAVIAALTGGSLVFIIVGAVVVFVVTTLIAVAIGTMFDRRRAG